MSGDPAGDSYSAVQFTSPTCSYLIVFVVLFVHFIVSVVRNVYLGNFGEQEKAYCDVCLIDCILLWTISIGLI